MYDIFTSDSPSVNFVPAGLIGNPLSKETNAKSVSSHPNDGESENFLYDLCNLIFDGIFLWQVCAQNVPKRLDHGFAFDAMKSSVGVALTRWEICIFFLQGELNLTG